MFYLAFALVLDIYLVLFNLKPILGSFQINISNFLKVNVKIILIYVFKFTVYHLILYFILALSKLQIFKSFS